MTTLALIPFRSFATAKQRLRPFLSDDECASLASAMLADVMAAVDAAAQVDGGVLLGGEDARQIAEHANWEWLDDRGDSEPNRILDRAAAELSAAGSDSLLILPADLPGIDGDAIDALLQRHRPGLSLCPAVRDGGTNALVVSPPDAIRFRYGRNSARHHLQAAADAGLNAQRLSIPAFERDIDTPEDLLHYCAAGLEGRTAEYLARSGIADRLLDNSQRIAGQRQ